MCLIYLEIIFPFILYRDEDGHDGSRRNNPSTNLSLKFKKTEVDDAAIEYDYVDEDDDPFGIEPIPTKATVRPGMMIHTGDSDEDSNHLESDNDQASIGQDRYHEAFNVDDQNYDDRTGGGNVHDDRTSGGNGNDVGGSRGGGSANEGTTGGAAGVMRDRRNNQGENSVAGDNDMGSDGGDSVFGVDGAVSMGAQIRVATGRSTGITFHVGHPIMGEDKKWHVKVLYSQQLPWFVTYQVMDLMLKKVVRNTMFHQRTSFDWTDTFTKHAIRTKPYGNNSYKRTASGWTTDYVSFTLSLDEDEFDNLTSIIDEIIAVHIQVFGKHPKRKIGSFVAAALQEVRPAVYDSELRKGSINTHDAVCERFTTKLNALFAEDKIDVQYDMDYNFFLTDYDIKQFCMDYIGMKSFEKFDEDSRRCLFGKYPEIALPQWNAIHEEALNMD